MTATASVTNSAKTALTTSTVSSPAPTHSQSVPAVNSVCSSKAVSEAIGAPIAEGQVTPDCKNQQSTESTSDKQGEADVEFKDVPNISSSAEKGNNSATAVRDELKTNSSTKSSMPDKVATPLSHKKYPAPQPPGSLSRQSSSASIARNSIAFGDNSQFPGAISRQLSSASINPKGADNISISGSATLPNRKCQRVASFKKYPAPPPPGVSRQNSMASMNGVFASDKTKPLNEKDIESKLQKTEELKPLVNGVHQPSSESSNCVDKKLEAPNDGKSEATLTKKKKLIKKNLKATTNGIANGESSEDISSVSSSKEGNKKIPSSSIAAKKDLFDSSKKDDKLVINTNKRSTSREVSVESNSTGDDRSRSVSKDTSTKRTVSGKLASITNKFEAVNTSTSNPKPPKSPVEMKTKKFVPKVPKNKLGSLASKFEATSSSVEASKNTLPLKIQSPYSKPFDPEPVATSLSSRMSIGGINVKKFGGSTKFVTQSQLKKLAKGESISDESESKESKTDDTCGKESSLHKPENEELKDVAIQPPALSATSDITKASESVGENCCPETNFTTKVIDEVSSVDAGIAIEATKPQQFQGNSDSISPSTESTEKHLKADEQSAKSSEPSVELLKSESSRVSKAESSVLKISDSVAADVKVENTPKLLADSLEKIEPKTDLPISCLSNVSASLDIKEDISRAKGTESCNEQSSTLECCKNVSSNTIVSSPLPLPAFDSSKIMTSGSKVDIKLSSGETGSTSLNSVLPSNIHPSTSSSASGVILPDVSNSPTAMIPSVKTKPTLSLEIPSDPLPLVSKSDILTPPNVLNCKQSFPLLDTALSPRILCSSLQDSDLNGSDPLSRSALGSLNYSRASSVSPIINGNLTLPNTFRARSLTPMETGGKESSLTRFKHRPRPMSFEARMAALKSGESILEDNSEPQTALEKYRKRKQMRNEAAKAKLDALIGEAKEMSLSDTGLTRIPENDLNKSSVTTSTEGTSEGLKFKLDLSGIREFLRKTEEEISKLPKYIKEPWSMAGILSRSDRGTTEPPRSYDSSVTEPSKSGSIVSDRNKSLSPSSPTAKYSSVGSDGDEDVYVDAKDAIDSTHMDTLMPLPADYERRCRSVTPNRVVIANTEKILSQTDVLLKRSRSGNSLKKSYSRSLSSANIEKVKHVFILFIVVFFIITVCNVKALLYSLR